ncbi:hypothetical protein [Candidatus Binatus sp.]|uniref:hypothetical protein n=1 Tax=Candidatus Binatus sp. TaxID=2811406 RepID=UPI003BBBEA36
MSRGFTLMRHRMLWINRDLRIAFSYEAARDHGAGWLTHALAERVPETDFVFHFSQVPANTQVCREILNELAMPYLTPYVRVGALRVGGAERD